MTSEPVKFLMVDDIDDNLVALEGLLQREGLQLMKARSGREALELLLVHDFALALLDVQMPEMNGFELAELMRGTERSKHIPIIFLTAGSRDPRVMFKGYDRGAVDFLYKPFDPVVLQSKADVFFELYRQRRDLQNALKLNEMFVGILGHDLRNPLSAMVTGVQVLKRQLADEKQQKNLNRMQYAAARMTDMIEQMLDLTRARLAGGIGFVRSRQPLDVAALARRAADELHVAQPERGLSVDVTGDAATTGDPDRLLQVFSNLIANAFTHGTPGTPVEVTVSSTAEEVRVEVANAGTIPRELMPSLFDPFRGRQKEAQSRGEGLGLGLFIAQQIAQAHGGSVRVTSTELDGTRFVVRLPRVKAAEQTAAAAAVANGARRQVLIVDDDPDVRDALSDVLEHEGYSTVRASNGQEALDLLAVKEQRPDAVILDMVMPIVGGAQVYETMQREPELKKIPVIVSTSTPMHAPEGAVVIPKPLSIDRLLETVGRLWK
ncbi:MAG: response regulator [Myxococcaceae bacterium]|nr:response regulator [Myxococcaceae bacterium]